jgi:hypothetical protein
MLEEFKEEEKRKDLIMEIERLKRIKFYEEQEKIRKEKLITDHHKIVDQIV